MGRERYIIEAIVREGRTHREVAAAAGVSKAWVTKLVARYRAGGELALEPRSRRPKSCAHATAPELQDAVLALRRDLDTAGHDAGPQTIHHHLSLTRSDAPSVATIWRILKRHGQVTPQPQKRPKSSFIRFQADLPNEMWQSDFTHWQLADDTGVEILNYLDDHSRLALACDAFITVKGLDVVNTFHAAADGYGFPAALLTDNGAVYTGRTRKGKVLLESELERLGIVYKNSRPYHPQTCGKVERFHQTLKR
jgi:transposase InsO family protein